MRGNFTFLKHPHPARTALVTGQATLTTYKLATPYGPTDFTVTAKDDDTAAWLADIQGFEVLSVADGIVLVNG